MPWNELPNHIRLEQNLNQFSKLLNTWNDGSCSGHLGTEHMRHLGTRYWTSRYSVLEISVLNNKNNLIEFKNLNNFFLHVDVVYTNFYVFFLAHLAIGHVSFCHG